jgi:Ca2+:H+ antiporter
MLKTAAHGLSALGTVAALLLRATDADPLITFVTSAFAVLGLAYTLGYATEQLGIAMGPRIGGILNATAGNIGEIIIAGFLIQANEIAVVHASITGSIIGNLLLVLGASLLAGGLKNGVQKYDAQVTGMNAASLILATIGLIVPATVAYAIGAHADPAPGDLGFSRLEGLTVGVAAVLLITYAAQMYFFLRSPDSSVHAEDETAEWSAKRSLIVLIASAAALTAVSETLVEVLQPTVDRLGVSPLFIGIIVIPIIGNLAEHVVGVTLAYKNKMDFSLLTSLGSATQIALFAAPVLVFLGLFIGHPLTLVFTPLEVVAVATSVFIASFIALDGQSNWVEGLQLTSVYVILALAFFFLT